MLQFSIAHYAGKVTYTAKSWIDKNRGYLAPDLAFLMSTSSSTLLSALFPRISGGECRKSSTVLASFRSSLRALSATLLQTNACYIRCLKPNASKIAGHFDGHFIARQLRYTGVSAVVEIQRSGYPISLPKADFFRRYRSCAFSDPALTSAKLPLDTLCANILSSIEALLGLDTSWLDTLSVQLGKTKIFLREEAVRRALIILNRERVRVRASACECMCMHVACAYACGCTCTLVVGSNSDPRPVLPWSRCPR